MKKRAKARFWVYAGIITETKNQIKHTLQQLTPFHPDPSSPDLTEQLGTSCSKSNLKPLQYA